MTPDHGNGGRRGSELWSLREDVLVQMAPEGGAEGGAEDDRVWLRSGWGEVAIQRPSPEVREALRRMLLGPISLENVTGGPVPGTEGAAEAPIYQVLDRLQPFVIRTLGVESGQPLLSVVPLSPRSRFRPVPIAPDTQVRLSTFAQLSTDGTEYRLESPLSLHRVLLHRPEAVWLLSSLGRPVTAGAWITAAVTASAWPHLEALAADALAYLVAVGMVVTGQDAAQLTEDRSEDRTEDGELAGWSATDLMFHARSNYGRHDNPIGATYPQGTDGSAAPVAVPRRADPAIPLHRPALDRLFASDPALSIVMEGRRSIRQYATRPVTAEDLGDLLYRTARIRSVLTPPGAGRNGRNVRANGHGTGHGTRDPRLSDRPYPGGGACYELELYITAGACAGIPRGIYHYDPFGHCLEPVTGDGPLTDALLRSAGELAATDGPPPVLITMTARVQRLSWKYTSVVYATVLKDAGVLLQNLYLVCTAMGLAPCALGYVNVELTARALGTDWRAEPTVGQFMVGQAPDALPETVWRVTPVNDPEWADQARERLRRH